MNNENNNNRKLVESLLQFINHHLIEETNFNMKSIEIRLKFYQSLLYDLKDDKPLFFQKKKLIEYNNKLEEYTKKVNDLYIEFNKELKILENFYEQI